MEACGNGGMSANLEFFTLIGKLKHMKRTGWVLRGVEDCESVAGHMYRMGMMSFLLGGNLGPSLDRDKCIKMALVHDMAECIVGDLTPFCGVDKEEKHRRENEAMVRLCALVSEDSSKEFMDLYKEYEAQETMEAKTVKDLDRFDMILQAFEYEKEMKKPQSLQCFFDNTKGLFNNPVVIKWVEDLYKTRSEVLPSS